ncbi:MAG: hypothetical protein NWR72_10410 [Bacteroidia bacterium]|nr:hypothetical protein [Bacteroidia bacterium]
MIRAITNYKGQIQSVFALIHLATCDIDSEDFLIDIEKNVNLFVGSFLRAVSNENIKIFLAIDYEEAQNTPGKRSKMFHLQEGLATDHNQRVLSELNLAGQRWQSIGEDHVNFIPIKSTPDETSKLFTRSISIESFKQEAPIKIIAFCTGANKRLPEWTQDLFWVLEDTSNPDNLKLLVSEDLVHGRSRMHQRPSLEALLEQERYSVLTTDLPLEGGNILVGEDFMLIGKEHITQYSATTGEAYQDILDWYWAAFKFKGTPRNVFVPGLDVTAAYQKTKWPLNKEGIDGIAPDSDQLIYHLDLYLTLGGKLANGKQLIFVAQYKPEEYLIGQIPDSSNIPKALAIISEWLDQQADWLENRTDGFFHVERIPILYFASSSPGFASFNNGLIENISPQEKYAYLPDYEFTSQEEKMSSMRALVENVFAKHQFSVKWIQGRFENMISDAGSLHCRVKVLRRQ